MAGECRPNVEGLGKEVQIIFNEFEHPGYWMGSTDALCNGITNDPANTAEGSIILDTYWGDEYIVFTLLQRANIWSIGVRYADSGGISDKPVALHKLGLDNQYYLVGVYPTNPSFDTWYKLFNGLGKGTYKVTPTARYATFSEWYAEGLGQYLYKTGNVVYGMQNGAFVKLADDWLALSDAEKKALFASTNYETPTTADLAMLGRFKVLMYSEDDGQQTLSLTAAPHDQLVMPKGLISIASFDGIDKVTLANTVAGKGVCKLIVTTDGAAYQTYDFAAHAWQPIDYTDLADVKTNGIDAAQLANIDRAGWDALTTGKAGIGFAYLLSIEATTDQCAVDRLDLQVDMRGSWDRAIHGTDYRYGYPANNVLRVSLLADGDYKINYAG